MRPLQRAFREQDAVVGDDPERHPEQVGKTADQRRAVERLELVERAGIDDACDHLARVVGRAQIGRHHAVQLRRIVQRRCGRAHRERRALRRPEAGDDAPAQRQRMGVVAGGVIDDARLPRVNIRPAEFLGTHLLAGRRLHQRRPAEKNGALAAHDDRLVRHRRHIGSARGAGPHHGRDLRDTLGRHPRLVEKDAAEMLAVGKHLVLVRQVGAAGIDEIDARQPACARDLLRAQMLLHRHREIRAALHRRVVGDDDAFPPPDAADAGDDPGRRHLAAIHSVRCKLRKLEERRAGVDQRHHPRARQHLAAPLVPPACRVAAARRRAAGSLAQFGNQGTHRAGAGAELIRPPVDGGRQRGHAVSSNNSRPISILRISLVPAPIS